MIRSIFEFLASEAGSRVIKWVLSSGLGLVILSCWIYSLSQKQERLELKFDKQEVELRQQARFQIDTLFKTLTRTNDILSDFKKSKR